MSQEYIKDLSRIGCSFYDLNCWYEGEFYGLKKLIGFGFENTFFLVENGTINSYYSLDECEQFYKILDEKITEKFFNQICDNFFELIEKSKTAESHEEIFKLMIEIWAILAIFHEISNYPEYANDSMLRRLLRVRKNTESFFYDLSNKLNKEKISPQNYLFFKGKVFEKPINSFIEENSFIIKNG